MRLLQLKWVLPIVMTIVYIVCVTSSQPNYYVAYEKIRGTYIMAGIPSFAHRAAFAINAPATEIAMLVLRMRGHLTGSEETKLIGGFVPVLWFLVGAFLDRATRGWNFATRAVAVILFLAAVCTPALIDKFTMERYRATRVLPYVWIAFAVWILWARSQWRRQVRPSPEDDSSDHDVQ